MCLFAQGVRSVEGDEQKRVSRGHIAIVSIAIGSLLYSPVESGTHSLPEAPQCWDYGCGFFNNLSLI